MTSVLYLGCPAGERDDAERLLRAAHVSVVWADRRRICAGRAAAARHARAPRSVARRRGAAAGAGNSRPPRLDSHVRRRRRTAAGSDDRSGARGMADVFARPLGGRRVASAIERELSYQSRDATPQRQQPRRRLVQPVAGDAGRDRADRRGGGEARGRVDHGRRWDRTAGRRARDSCPAEPSSGAAFVTINCAAYDTEELDAALFGAAARLAELRRSWFARPRARQPGRPSARRGRRDDLRAERRRRGDEGAGPARSRPARSRSAARRDRRADRVRRPSDGGRGSRLRQGGAGRPRPRRSVPAACR